MKAGISFITCFFMLCLQLSRKVELRGKIQKIPLPPPDLNLEDGEECQVSGWGKTETDNPSNELRVVNVSVINPQECQEKWPGLPARVTCAGGYPADKGFCQVCFLCFE